MVCLKITNFVPFCKRTFSFAIFILVFSLFSENVFVLGQLEFICPGGKDGLYPHPTQCDRYFECINRKVKRRLCADGLAFDPLRVEESDPCNQVHNIKGKCRERSDLQRPQPGDANCPRQNGVYPSPDVTVCDIFYTCLNGKSSVKSCTDGLYFDPTKGICDWARDSTRKGCLSDSQRRAKEPKRRRKQNQPQQESSNQKAGERLANGFQCPGGKLGLHPALPHPNSCILYYVCLNGGTPSEAGCGRGLVFNSKTGKCDKPENVPGCENTYAKKGRPQRPPPPNKSNNRGNNRGSNRENSNISKDTRIPTGNGNSVSIDDLTRFFELVNNPGIRNILKPEIIEALGPQKSGLMRDNPNHNSQSQQSQSIQQLVDSHQTNEFPRSSNAEDAPETLPNRNPGLRTRKIPKNRRNKFTSRFLPKIKPVGNLDNLGPIHQPEQDFELQREEARRQNIPAQQAIIPEDVQDISKEETVKREPEPQPTTDSRNRTPLIFKGERRRPPGFRVRPRLRRPNPQRNQQPIEEITTEAVVVPEDGDQDIEQIGADMLKKLFNDSPNSRPLSDIIPDRKEAGDFKNDFGEFFKEFRRKKLKEQRLNGIRRPSFRRTTNRPTTTTASTTTTTTTTTPPTTTTTTTTSTTTTTTTTTTARTTTTTTTTTLRPRPRPTTPRPRPVTRRPTFRVSPVTTNLPPRPTTLRPKFRLPPLTTTTREQERFITTTKRPVVLDSFIPTRRPISLDSSPLLSNQTPNKVEPLSQNLIPTLPPLEDEDGPFEYVYYYEYEYDEEIPLPPEPTPPKSSPVQEQNVPKPTFNFQTKIPSLSDFESPVKPQSPSRLPLSNNNRKPSQSVSRDPSPPNPSVQRRPSILDIPVQRLPPSTTSKPEVRRPARPPKSQRQPEPIQRKPVPPPRPVRPSPTNPTPSPKRPKNPPSRLPVFSFFPQIVQQEPNNVQEFPRSNIAPRPQINNPPKQSNKGRKPVSSASKQRGNPPPRPSNRRPQPKDIEQQDVENDFRLSNQRKPRPQATESPPPPPTRPPPTQRGRVQSSGNTPFTAFNNFPQFPRTPEPQVSRERAPSNNVIPPQPTRAPESNQREPVFQSRFPAVQPVRPIPQSQSSRPRPTFGVFESVQLQTGGQLQTPIDTSLPQQPLPPPPSAPRQPPPIQSQVRPAPRPQSQGLVNNVIVHDSGSQSSSFFSFNRPLPQPQQFSNEQPSFTNRFQSNPSPPQQQPSFLRFGEPQQSSTQQFSSFLQDFEQPTFDSRGVPQTPRFSARPNPVSNPQFSRPPPSSQQQQRSSFESERPLRTQRALPPQLSGEENSSDKVVSSFSSTSKQNTINKNLHQPKTEKISFPKKEEFNFPDAEFGGFVPVSSRNRRKSNNWSNFFY